MKISNIFKIVSLLCITFLLFSVQNVYSQKFANEFGLVEKSVLEAEIYPNDTTADAVIVSDYGYKTIKVAEYKPWSRAKYGYVPNRGFARERIFGLFDYVIETYYQQKIKILKESGISKSVINIDYFNKRANYSEEIVDDIEAWRYWLEKGEVKREKFDNNSIVERFINDSTSQITISFPNAKLGDIVEYRYRRVSPLYVGMRNWKLQRSIPVMAAAFETFFYDVFVYNAALKGDYPIKRNLELEYPKLEDIKQSEFDGREAQRIVYVAINLPAEKSLPYIQYPTEHVSGVDLELRSVRKSGYVPYAYRWQDVDNWIDAESEFNRYNYGKDFYKKELKPILKSIKNERKRVETIYKFVKDKIKWNGKIALYSDPIYAVKNGEGDNAQINSVLMRALTRAGIYVYPILISTRNNGKFNDIHPTHKAINTYILCVSSTDGNIYLLDGSAVYGGLNMLSTNLLPEYGRTFVRDYNLEEGQTNTQIALDEIANFKSSTTILLSISADDSVSGVVSSDYQNLAAFDIKTDFHNFNSTDSWVKSREQRAGISISNYKISDINDKISSEIKESFNYKKESEKKDGIVKILPFNGCNFVVDKRVTGSRKAQIEFRAITKQRVSAKILLPENSEVVSFPKSVSYKTEDGKFCMKYDVKVSKNSVKIELDIEIGKLNFGGEEIAYAKDIINTIVDKIEQPITIKLK